VGRHRRRFAQFPHSVPFGEDHVAVLDDGHGDPRNIELVAGAFHHLVDVILRRANGGGEEETNQNTKRASTATV
jgi:hypothetical protein